MAYLYDTNEWTFEKLKVVQDAIEEIAFEELKLDVYPNQIEIIGSDQMLDAYSSSGLPIMYGHWSYGKRFLSDQFNYRKGYSGLAYEIVINSNPCISYLMEENSMTMQTLVIAHAAYGHNHFFKNNYLFKQWTQADAIIDYLVFAKNYIAECEEKYGPIAVEEILDACHALQFNGVDRYKRPPKLSKEKEIKRQKERIQQQQLQVSELWKTIPQKEKQEEEQVTTFPSEPQENILYFIEKNSPTLEPWQREVVRIVRKIAQYFWPQVQTKVMNEGWASFTHYYIMSRMFEKGQISEGNYLEFLHSHTGVVNQLPYNHKYYNGFNPYALGIDMFNEIRRVCEQPTKEDEVLFPSIVGQNWLDVCLDAVRNYRDESFIMQFMTPNLIKKWKFFEVTDLEDNKEIEITAIQSEKWYRQITSTLSRQYSINRSIPNIQIVDSNLKTTRELKLKYEAIDGKKLLESDKRDTLNYLKRLWGYEVSFV